jgi:hypothetical protein
MVGNIKMVVNWIELARDMVQWHFGDMMINL